MMDTLHTALDWDAHLHLGSFSGLGPQLTPTPKLVNELSHDHQTQTEALAVRGFLTCLDKPVLLQRAHASPAVANNKAELMPPLNILKSHRHINQAVFAESGCIGQQVDRNLPELLFIEIDDRWHR
ncbi:hypothetical protein D9M68_815790 [compost metagenome]